MAKVYKTLSVTVAFLAIQMGQICIVSASNAVKDGPNEALDRKLAAWNRHDLDQVLAAYFDSKDTSIVSSSAEACGFEAVKA